MAGRIRTLKPELLEDEKTASLPDAAFRLFVSLILLADDHGNLRATPTWLEGQIWWCSTERRDVRALLARLARRSRDSLSPGLVEFYAVHGQPYLHLTGWNKHQRVDRPSAPRVPTPDEGEKIETIQGLLAIWDGLLAEASRDPHEDIAEDSRLISDPDLRPRPPTADGTAPAAPAAAQVSLPLAPLTSRQTLAMESLRDVLFRVSGWSKPEDTVREILGEEAAASLARDLGGDAYPAVSVRQAIAQAAAWCRSNPAKAKTPRGLSRFLTAWFEREQNRGGGLRGSPPGGTGGAAQQDLAAKLREAGLS
jgi:hypothetical protein